jgi:hypothetical protein
LSRAADRPTIAMYLSVCSFFAMVKVEKTCRRPGRHLEGGEPRQEHRFEKTQRARGDGPVTGRPRTTEPWSGRMRPAKIETSVVFPAPENPTTETNCRARSQRQRSEEVGVPVSAVDR